MEHLGYKKKLDEVDEAILKNADFLGQIVANPEIFGHEVESENDEETKRDSPDAQDHLHDHDAGTHCLTLFTL